MNLLDEFSWRGLLHDSTEGLGEALASSSVTVYAGFDPTASSLHVGSLLPIMALARLQRCGHSPIAVVGGGTGLIGDPSGKASERALLDALPELDRRYSLHADQIAINVAGIRGQLERFLDFAVAPNAARLVDNAEWLTRLNAMEFLREVGKYFTVNYMLAKDSVKRRLASEEGVSYTEFSYLLLQAYDFLVLHDRFHCTVQLGGSDQWGNITAGCDLIRRLRSSRVYGLVTPLVTSATGTKFGKTESGAVWLDPARTSPFRFYQFWLNVDDADVVRYLKFFTFLDQETVTAVEQSVAAAPEQRAAQRLLAREVTTLVHGADAVTRAEHASSVLFGEGIATLPVEDALAVFEDAPSTELAASLFAGEGMAIVDLLARVRLAASKSEARRLVQAGGVYVNNRRAADVAARVDKDASIGGRVFVLRRGQRQMHLVKLVDVEGASGE